MPGGPPGALPHPHRGQHLSTLRLSGGQSLAETGPERVVQGAEKPRTRVPFQKGKGAACARGGLTRVLGQFRPHGWQGGVRDSPGAKAAARGGWSSAEAPAVDAKAGAARRVPGPVCALPPLPGTGGAARGREVSGIPEVQAPRGGGGGILRTRPPVQGR